MGGIKILQGLCRGYIRFMGEIEGFETCCALLEFYQASIETLRMCHRCAAVKIGLGNNCWALMQQGILKVIRLFPPSFLYQLMP